MDFFIDNSRVKKNTWLKHKLEELGIFFGKHPKNLYFLMILSPHSSLPIMIVSNITGKTIITGDEIVQLPPVRDNGTYSILLFKQQKYIAESEINETNSFSDLELVKSQQIDVKDDHINIRDQTHPIPGSASRSREKENDHPLIIPNSGLTEQEQKYCSCVVKVSAKKCTEGKTCVSPYPICAKSTKTTYRHCRENYDYSQFSDVELKSFAKLSKVAVPRPYIRRELIERLQKKN